MTKKTKLLVELTTDMYSDSIGENAVTMLDVINQVSNSSIKENKIFKTIIQSDLRLIIPAKLLQTN